NAFNEIPLETIYYNGTVEQWNSIKISYSCGHMIGSYYGYGYFYGNGGQTKIYCTGSSTTYTVNYNANGGTVSPTSATVNIGSSTTLPTPTKNFKLIFNANGGTNAPAAQNFPVTCKGWSTSSTATSATYSCGASYKPSSSTTLYAVWNSSSESAKITTAVPTRSGYKFLGWGASSTDTAPKHKSGDSIYLTGGDVTLFAVWEKTSTPETTYTVNYNANGGSVSPTSATVNKGGSTTLPTPTKNFKLIFNANGGTNAPAAQNFPVTCKGWSTSSTATSATYSCGASYKPSSSTTLYAVWNSSSESAKITTAVPTRSGYKFLGWGSSSTDTAPKHKSGDTVYLTGGDVTLFAVWEKTSTPTDPDLKDAIFIRTKEMNLDKQDVTAALSTIVIADKYNTTDYTFEFECSKPNALQYDIEMKEDNETYYLALGQNGVTGTFKFYVRLYKIDGHVLIDEDYITVNVRDSVYYETISLNYKKSYQLNFDSSEYVFATDNGNVATVDENGKIYASGTGSTVIMAIDNVDYGVHYYKVNVSYSFLQYLILIFLFGWLWY
ncbi:MAG: InlB B-repeat-containing protein, partial [Ruminococcus sp.]|nr:InlB B-repeat-containing protein [Candidatus Copronaster equi]